MVISIIIDTLAKSIRKRAIDNKVITITGKIQTLHIDNNAIEIALEKATKFDDIKYYLSRDSSFNILQNYEEIKVLLDEEQ